MVNKRMQTLLTQLRPQGIRDEKLLRAIEAVPRERLSTKRWITKPAKHCITDRFRPDHFSAPMVARMTELLNLKPTSRVLEIGTGSGYQTAILAHLVQHVCSVERIKGLQWQAKRRLKQLDLHNVSTRHGDGWQRAGRRAARSMRSSSPPHRRRSRRRWWSSWTTAAFWVLPVGEQRPKPSNAFSAMATISWSMRSKRCALCRW